MLKQNLGPQTVGPTNQAIYVKRNFKALRQCCCGKAITVTYSECVCVCVSVALDIQHAMRMRHIVTYGHPTLQYFSTLSHKWQNKKKEHKIRVFILCAIFVWNVSHYNKKYGRHDKKNVYWSSCKVASIPVRLEWNLNFLDMLSKTRLMSDFMKICKVEVELFHANRRKDGQTRRS